MTIQKLFLITVTITAVILMIAMIGCTQVIIEDVQVDDRLGKRFKINTFLMTSGLETLYYDPNQFDVGKYKGIPADIEFEYNPITHIGRVKTSAE